MVDPADTTAAAHRFLKAVGLYAIDTSQVTLVSADSICALAGAALDSIARIPPSTRQVYVVKIGGIGFAAVDKRDGYPLNTVPIFGTNWICKAIAGFEG